MMDDLLCTWKDDPDAPECGEPADACRGWLDSQMEWRRAFYCRRHLRRLASKEEAARQGVMTWPVEQVSA